MNNEMIPVEQILWNPLGNYSSNMADVHGLSFSKTGGMLKTLQFTLSSENANIYG